VHAEPFRLSAAPPKLWRSGESASTAPERKHASIQIPVTGLGSCNHRAPRPRIDPRARLSGHPVARWRTVRIAVWVTRCLSLCVALGAALAGAASVAGAQRPRTATTRTVSPTGILAQQRRMPSVIDSTLDGATRLLALLKLTPAPTFRDTPIARLDGRVFSQEPAAGQPIPVPPAPITLGVYRYVRVDSVTVPLVTGTPLLLAIRQLQRAGLVPRYSRQGLLSTAVATVSGQAPVAGARVALGDTVSLTLDVSIRVPWVVGADVATATQRLVRQGLVLELGGGDYSDSIAAGRIVRQRPDSGMAAHPGEAVTVWTSRGQHPREPEHRMPLLRGRSLAEATAALAPLGLAVTHVDSAVDAAMAGRIVAQRPREGATVHPSDQVDVTLAVLPQGRRVPWVVGRPLSAGAQVMRDSGFTPRPRLVPADGAARGMIIAQSVDSGVIRPPRALVVLTATDTAGPPPPQTRDMPNVVGMERREAIQALQFLAPALRTVEVATPREEEANRVVSQAPPAGTIVLEGVAIVLRVGRFAPLQPPRDSQPTDSAIVPAVEGLGISEARELLARADLLLGDVTAVAPGTDSVIARQDPGAGIAVARGSAVAVTLQDSAVGGDTTVDIITRHGGEGSSLLWWLLGGAGGVVATAVIMRLRRRSTPAADTHDERGRDDAAQVTLRPSPLPPPAVQLPEEQSVVAHEVTLVDGEPECSVDFPGSLIAREEVPNERPR
jgi:beta-lactam-binding protein with PASTA domain